MPSRILVEVAIESRRRRGRVNLLVGAMRRAALSSRLGAINDVESGQIVVGVVSDDHLAAELDEVRRTSGLGIHTGPLQPAYR